MNDYEDDDAYTTHPEPTRVVMFLVCLAALLAGFWLMGSGVTNGNGLVFAGGLLVSGIAFGIPMRDTAR
ncbi:hypothetical protein [Actinotalea subterranea]|uniref:hypothetical protein n=1 Tax=Actinotalea subterranea TaxID=2607497 RepID=UPI0011EEACB1|nr:hypothetical protein [Actinotalea subterranea]